MTRDEENAIILCIIGICAEIVFIIEHFTGMLT